MAITALLIGIAGSFHCLGMCSPLAMAVTGVKRTALFNRLLYNAGRIFTYTLLGGLVSGVGLLLPLARFQNIISIGLGVILLAIAAGGIRSIAVPGLTTLMLRFSSRLKAIFSRQLARKNQGAILMMGMLNGLLPCGLTVVALTWCLTLKGPVDGFSFMLLFGAGTLPAMLGAPALLPALAKKFNWNIRGLSTSMLIFSGFALIARVFLVHLPHATSLKDGIVDIILCR